jgi:hypothetical protein
MRRVVPFLLLLAVSACGFDMRWVKPGATDELVAADMTSCRSAARQEANRYWPYGYYPFSGYGWGHRSVFWMTRADDDRLFTENRLTAFCMRTKGYEQVEVRKPQTQPPPPPSPEPN